jgi:hypothetical protein
MTTQNDNGFATFTAAEALAIYRRVKLSSTSNRTVAYADAGEKAIGVTQAAAESTGDLVTVKLFTTPGTFKLTAKTSMATRNGNVYGADDGYVDDAASGGIIGYNLDTASGVGAIIEVAPIADLPLTEADAVATIDDDSGGTTSGTEQLSAISALTCLAAIDNDSGGTDSGTEQLAAVAALTCLAAIDDDSGGTNSGTEQLAAVAALTTLAAIDDDAAGTNNGTEQFITIFTTAGTAAAAARIRNNFKVTSTQLNRMFVDMTALRTRIMNGQAVLADEHNKLRVDVAALRTRTMNGQTVLAKEHNKLRVDVDMLRTRMLQAHAVLSDQINAIIASLQGAGFMAT